MSVAYIRYKEDLPDNSNSYAAADGFLALGYKVIPYYGFGDAPINDELLTDSVLTGTIGDVWFVLKKLGRQIPSPLDYPDHLRFLLDRQINLTTLGLVKASSKRIFVKPVQQKLFTGRVWDPFDRAVRFGLAIYEDSTPVWTSDIVIFEAEYRCFVLDDVLLDVKRYRGDWATVPDRHVVMSAIHESKGKMPQAYSLDFGVTCDGRTLLVEANDSYSLGSYGLNSVQYAKMIEARWRELTM